jgi:DNA-binding transcriptional LysR family regulator
MPNVLATDRLEAFEALASAKSFTEAGRAIGVTQSALSQRVAKLEADLEVTLFVRSRRGVTLSAEGEMLLRYCRAREGLEREMLAGLKLAPEARGEASLQGVLRIAGFSSVVRSVLLPALGPLVRSAPELVVHVASRELRELPELLRSGEADFVVLDRELGQSGIETAHLGEEINVLVESKRHAVRPRCFLDHDPDDATTERFMRLNRRSYEPQWRSFLDDIYGILDAAVEGWGRAVISRHMLASMPELSIVRGVRPLVTPVVLHFRRQPYYTRLHRQVVATLVESCPAILATAPGKRRPA